MGAFIDLSGKRFGRLVAIRRAPNKGGKTMWECKCDCGNYKIVDAGDMKNGKVSSCGCLKRERDLSQIEDLTGKKFGRLTVIGVGAPYVSNNITKVRWLCKCDCGNTVEVRASYLKDGRTKSCGCYQMEMTSAACTTHGMSHSRLFAVWSSMIQRCTNENNSGYKNYGGRGICVCDEWMDFVAFKDWAILSGYDEDAPYGQCTIDRINNDGNYEPSNCRWVDMLTQSKNKRNSKQ